MLSFPRFRVVYLQQALVSLLTAEWAGVKDPHPQWITAVFCERIRICKNQRGVLTLQLTEKAQRAALEQMSTDQRAHIIIAAVADSRKSFWGLLPSRFRVYLQEEDFLERKKKELTECQRSLWGKQMVLLSNEIHQSPGDVKSASGYTGNKMSRTETHGVWNIRLNATFPLCGKKVL